MSLTIYKASAGSGKTFTLAATFIAHLLSSEGATPHRHQLAVTFTNKATAEMKERILQHLYDLAFGTDDKDGFFLAVRKLTPERITNRMIRQLSKKMLHSIIHDYDHFHVTTIDAFFQSLLANLAHELNLSASFKVEISDKEVIGKAITQMLENIDVNSKQMQWIKAYIRERMNDDKAWNIEYDLKDLAQQILKEDYMLYSHLLHQGSNGGFELSTNAIQDYKRRLRELAQTARTQLIEKAKKLDQHIKSDSGLGYANISSGERWYGAYIAKLADRRIAISDKTDPSPTICRAAEDPKCLLTKKNQNNSTLLELAGEVQRGLRKLLDCYFETKAQLVSCELSIGNLNPLWLLDSIQKEVELINKENNRILLAKTPLLFHNLSSNADTSFIFERAGTQFQHIMIDEFQDTSKLQWSNMRHLLVENMAQDNSCMLVGDVKQGIYRFRGGDWNALASFRAGYNPALNAEIDIETLKTNFRSGKHIIDFNNRLFVSAAHAVHDALQQSAKEVGYPATQISHDVEQIYPTPDPEHDNHEVTQLPHNEGGFVRLQLTDTKPSKSKNASPTQEAATQAEAEDFCVEASLAEQMLRLHAEGVPFKEMAILIRWNSEATKLLNYFGMHHGHDSQAPIPLVSEEAFLLSSSSAIQVIIHALRYVADPTHEIALEYVRRHCPAERWEEAYALLQRWHKESYSGLPFYEVSCRLIRLFDLDQIQGQSPYVYYFLDALLSYVDENSANVKKFLDFWDESLYKKAIPSAVVDGVRIITIHKSKGLAYHSVFLPYCDWAIFDKPEIRWVKPSKAPFDAIPLLPIKVSKKTGCSIYRDVYFHELFDSHIENLNIIYVAFTRARQNLLIWCNTHNAGISTIIQNGVNSMGANDNIVEKSEITTVYEFGSPSHLECATDDDDSAKSTVEAETSESTADTTLPHADEKRKGNPLKYDSSAITLRFAHFTPHLVFKQSNNAQSFFSPTAEDDTPTPDVQEQHRQTGILLHLLMSSIERIEDVERQVDAFARQGIIPSTMSDAALKRLIHRRISHPTAAGWFDGSWRLYRECAIVFRENGQLVTRRPDRVMTRGHRSDGTDETIVIDFKFGRYHPEHRQQVEQYVELLHRQGYTNVKGFLWYLYSGSIEEVTIA